MSSMIQALFKVNFTYNSIKKLIIKVLHLTQIVSTFLEVIAVFKTQQLI